MTALSASPEALRCLHTVAIALPGWRAQGRSLLAPSMVLKRRSRRWRVSGHQICLGLCYQKMSSARMSRGETLVLVMQPAQDRPTHDLALAPGR